MRILITGITGFVGGHLAEALFEQPGAEVSGVGLRPTWPPGCEHLAARVCLHVCDLADGAAVEAILREARPEQIYHLAGYAQTGQSFHEPDAAWDGNLTATRRLYEAVARWGGRPRILFVGSGLIYGESARPEQGPDERAPFCPVSPYAASKAAADLASYQYSRAPGLDIVRARPFNHIGPRQAPQFAIAHFAQQIAAIELGQQPPLLETGNLSPVRDLTDVRDVARAYMLLLEKGRTGEAYNVGSGRAWSIQAVLDRLLQLTPVRIEVRQKPGLVRATDVAAVYANADKLRQETGWAPRYTLEQTLEDTLNYWRSTLRATRPA